MNQPNAIRVRMERWLSALPPEKAYSYRNKMWHLQRYAHIVGLDNAWQMFGRQSRFNWWFIFKAVDSNGKSTVLPLPLQSLRTFWQRTFFDFREAKYHLNLYPSEELRQSYAYDLCREYPSINGVPTQSITIELDHQMLLSRTDAGARNTHLEPDHYSRLLNTFRCPS